MVQAEARCGGVELGRRGQRRGAAVFVLVPAVYMIFIPLFIFGGVRLSVCVCLSEAVLAAGLAAMAAVLDADSRVRDGIRSARFLDTLTNSVRYDTRLRARIDHVHIDRYI
jgi:hypothetical protein